METVLGIFCKQPIPGKVKTRLAKDIGDEPAARLYEAFLKDIVERLRATADDRVLCYTSDDAEAAVYFEGLSGGDYRLTPQSDGNLGVRLAAFFTGAFIDGPRKVIVIGSDSPTITRALIRSAAQELDRRDAVIGKSEDGGYYLIGLRRMARGIFEDIDWSTSFVYDQQFKRLLDAGLVAVPLLPIPEIDTIEDLGEIRDHRMLQRCHNTQRVLNDLNLL